MNGQSLTSPSIPSIRNKSGTHGQMYTNWMVTAFDQLDMFDPTKWPSFRYCCYQREVCPTTNREHIQGYVMFAKRVSLAFLKKLDGTAHFEPRRGTHEQAKDYCSKEDTRKPGCEPVESGDPPKPGKRTDLHDVADAITAGSSIRDLCVNHTPAMIKYSKGVQYVKMMITPRRRWDMDVIVIYGPTGLGKSQLADEIAPDAYRVPLAADKNTLWFDGYSGEDDVIIEEFEGYRCTYSFLKEFLDRYPCMVPTKGGHANFSSKRVILTSNTDPQFWYKWNEKRQYAPLERRFTRVLEFTADHHYILRKGEDPIGLVPDSPDDESTQPTEADSLKPQRTGVLDKLVVDCIKCGLQFQSDDLNRGTQCPHCADRQVRAENLKSARPKKKSKKPFGEHEPHSPPPLKKSKKNTKL